MDKDEIVDLVAKHYEEKIKKKQTISARRPISHIDAFYGRGNSGGVLDRGVGSFIGGPSGAKNESINNLNSLIQRAQHDQDQSLEDAVEYISHRKTKIICSLGSSTSNFPAIIELLRKGMNICRINTAQIQNKEHKILIEMVRKAAKVARKKCGIYIDLQGPRIRLGDIEGRKPSIKIKAGQKFLLYCKKKVMGNNNFIGVENTELAKKVKVGDHIICDHGKAFLKVTGFKDEDEFLAEQAESKSHPEDSRIHKIISHRGTLTTIGDNKKSKYEKRQQQLNDITTEVILNNDPDMIDNTGIQNYVRLSHARPVDLQSHQILDGSAFTHVAIDASLFESTRTIGWCEAEEYFMDCDKRLINQIIAKGRFSNQIAKALHEEKKTDTQYELTINVESAKGQHHGTQRRSSTDLSTGSVFGKLGHFNESSEHLLAKASQASTLQTISEEVVTGTPRGTKDAMPSADSSASQSLDISQTKSVNSVEATLSTAAQDSLSSPTKQIQTVKPSNSLEEAKLDAAQSLKLTPIPSSQSSGAAPAEAKQSQASTAQPSESSDAVKPPTAQSTPVAKPAPAKAAAKAAPAAGARRRRQIKKPEEKKKELKVIECTAELDGEIMAGKSIYLPEVDLKEALDLPVVDQQDLILINSLIKLGVDFVSVGGVETKEDLNEVKELLSVKGRHIKLLAKLQSRKALANFDELLEEADGVVIARGQLGLEFQIEDIAFIQQYIINRCNHEKKPVILSTEIMDSMITRLRPTRSEVADISKAISDGIDCLILTGETSFGPNWKEATEYMSKICYEAEQNQNYEVKYNIKQSILLEKNETLSIEESMSNNAVSASYMLGAKLIILFSNTGEQAITVAKFSPQCPVLAVLSSESFSKNVMLHSGIYYMTVGSQLGRESLIGTVKKEAMDMKLVRKGDVVIILTGMKEGLTAGNNWIQTDVI